MDQFSQKQRGRLNYLEFRLFFTGRVSRSELISRFGIKEAAATRDLSLYRKQAPDNLGFDATTKTYFIKKEFALRFLKEVDPVLLLRALIHGVGNDFESDPEVMVPYELPSRMHAPSPDILAAVSRAICLKKVLKIEYISASGNHGSREIVPFSLDGTGLKWMVRAYNRRRKLFGHFILNRIKSAEVLLDSVPELEETKEFDDEWNRMLKLELIPHPNVKGTVREMIEHEYKMEDGVCLLRVRAALAGYVLNLWSVDCTPDRSLEKNRLCLRNLLALHDVENAHLAPGYIRPEGDHAY